MAFDKNEVKQLKDLFIEQDKQIDKKFDDFALMVKKGFDEMGGKLDDHSKENKQELSEIKRELKQVRMNVANLEFIATEMVRRDEFLALKQEVEFLKSKLKLV